MPSLPDSTPPVQFPFEGPTEPITFGDTDHWPPAGSWVDRLAWLADSPDNTAENYPALF